jgi:hypothetical protein
MKTKADALKEIIWDATRTRRATRTSYKRVVKAMQIFGLTQEEQLDVLRTLEYVNYRTGELHEFCRDDK